MCCGGVAEMKTGKTKICYNSSTRGPLGEISTETSLISAETDKERNLYEKGKGDQKRFLATSAGLRCQHLANGVIRNEDIAEKCVRLLFPPEVCI